MEYLWIHSRRWLFVGIKLSVHLSMLRQKEPIVNSLLANCYRCHCACFDRFLCFRKGPHWKARICLAWSVVHCRDFILGIWNADCFSADNRGDSSHKKVVSFDQSSYINGLWVMQNGLEWALLILHIQTHAELPSCFLLSNKELK